jgi:hypothetical protein
MAEKTETYKLKDQETSFYDDETGLSVTRDEEVKIGMTKGKKTLAMIRTGGLIKVNSSAAEGGAGSSAAPKTGSIPDDFAHAKLLADNGVTTFAQLRQLDTKQLVDLKGIGEKKAEEIEKALSR